MHGGHRQFVVRVLNRRQPLGELTLVVVIHLGEVGDALAPGMAQFVALLQVAAQNVAHGFAAGRIAALFDERVKGGGQPFRERNGKSVHQALADRSSHSEHMLQLRNARTTPRKIAVQRTPHSGPLP